LAIYHLTAKVFSRGKGHSAVAAAAYRSRSGIEDERTGRIHDYSRKSAEVLFAGVYAPQGAPDWARDRAQLWNHVEAFEKRRDAQLAREFEVALPSELSLEQNRYALQDWVRENFTRRGLIADVAIHAPGKGGDERNIHAHVLVVMRKLDGSEFAAKKERTADSAERKAALENLRESWERIGNRHLERHGHAPTLDRRTLLAQGSDRPATIHLGKDATAMERRGEATELGDHNRTVHDIQIIDLAVARRNRELAAQEAARQPGPGGAPQPARIPDAEPAADHSADPRQATRRELAAARPDRPATSPPEAERAAALARQQQRRDWLAAHRAEQAAAARDRMVERDQARRRPTTPRQPQPQQPQQQPRAAPARQPEPVKQQPRPVFQPAAFRQAAREVARDLGRVERAADRASHAPLMVAGAAARAGDRVLMRLTDFADKALDFLVGAPAPRMVSVAEYLADKEARAAFLEQVAAARAREDALDRMAEDRQAGRHLAADDVRCLTVNELENIKRHGDDYMKQLIDDHLRTRERRSFGRERER
jgi:hypothetical protein